MRQLTHHHDINCHNLSPRQVEQTAVEQYRDITRVTYDENRDRNGHVTARENGAATRAFTAAPNWINRAPKYRGIKDNQDRVIAAARARYAPYRAIKLKRLNGLSDATRKIVTSARETLQMSQSDKCSAGLTLDSRHFAIPLPLRVYEYFPSSHRLRTSWPAEVRSGEFVRPVR